LKTLLDLENGLEKNIFISLDNLKNPFFCATRNRLYQSYKFKLVVFFLFTSLIKLPLIRLSLAIEFQTKIYINERIDACRKTQDGTFGFSLIEYNLSFDIVATSFWNRRPNNHGLLPEVLNLTMLFIFGDSLLNFTSLSHASLLYLIVAQKSRLVKWWFLRQKNNVYVCSCTSRFDGWHASWTICGLLSRNYESIKKHD
jgi:chloramphenicol O-acetyltransferase type A